MGRATALALVAAVLSATPGQADQPAAPGHSHDPHGGIRDQAGGPVAISREPATGRIGFVRATGVDGDLLPGRGAGSAAAAAAKATDYLDEFGPAFGATDGRLERAGVTRTPHGWVVRFDQTYRGLPVFGAQLKASVDRSGDLTAVSGYAAPALSVDTTSRLTAAEAGRAAVAVVRADPPGGRDTDLSGIRPVDPELMVYRLGSTRGQPGEAILAWSVEVTNERNVRDRVFLAADSGKPVNRYSMVETALHRVLFEGTTAHQVWEEGDPYPGHLDAEQRSVVASTGEAYQLFRNTFGWDSYNDAGAWMKSVADYTGNEANCPNALWNGRTTNFCDGFASDDVVAHEWAHAYTDHTSGLVYQWQPGAMSEAYSDIWGETVDQINGRGDENETADDKWVIGEKAPSFTNKRDMYEPNSCGDPGRVTDADYYYCGDSGDVYDDYGGVHQNSGVVNHAYALLVDGGTYNGQTITGIGLDKAAHLFWQAQSAHLTPTSGFADLADALASSCTELTGKDLTPLSTAEDPATAAPVVIAETDCDEVDRVVTAVELRREPAQCDYEPLLAKNPPRPCGRRYRPVTTWHERFRDGLRGWHQSVRVASPRGRGFRWHAPVEVPRHRNRAAFTADPDGQCTGGRHDLSSVSSLAGPPVRVRSGRAPRLAFRHYVATERGFDGGLVRIKVNRRGWQLVPRRAYRYNGPNTHLNYGGVNSNPLSGYPAWTGTDGGEVTGSWGTTWIDLRALHDRRGRRLVHRGDRIRVRFDFGRDSCDGVEGWYVDDVRLVVCRRKHAAAARERG